MARWATIDDLAAFLSVGVSTARGEGMTGSIIDSPDARISAYTIAYHEMDDDHEYTDMAAVTWAVGRGTGKKSETWSFDLRADHRAHGLNKEG